MCGRYELLTEFESLPSVLKEDLPKGFKDNYAQQKLIKPTDPVIVLRNEGTISTSFMLWGFISEWVKDPFNSSMPRPFNARSETISKKKLFMSSWRHKRCLLPASGFFEKDYRIAKKDSKTFWLAGIWSKWMNAEGCELESCCILTTSSNNLLKPIHDRMPVIIPIGFEEDWLAPVKSLHELIKLESMFTRWSSDEWYLAPIEHNKNQQMNLF